MASLPGQPPHASMIPETLITALSNHLDPVHMVRETSVTLFITDRPAVTDAMIIEGGSDGLTLPFREIWDRSQRADARHILLMHTHPSGDPRPSTQDIRVTRRLCVFMRPRGMRLMDHIILTQDQYFSFRLHRML
ncbi:MAG: JAB domain-containing protein [Sphingobium sp.]|nr:Mov34/MPN/PAD-1 family protein [Sphingobium sp.]MCP5397872.1 Mov34/MPN/PAD-1 family protein [Sphingomonas sp.]